MSTANAELRRPTGVGCSDLLGGIIWLLARFCVWRLGF
jgi:hypothetical protein